MGTTYNGRQASSPSGPKDELPTYERIIQSAGKLFLEKGYDGTSISKIAQTAGVTSPAVYWHFKSKEALYFAFIHRDYEEFLLELRAAATGGSPEERLRSYVISFVEQQLGGDPEIVMKYGFDQLLMVLSDEHREELVALRDEFNGLLKDILTEGRDAGTFRISDVTVTALAIITTCEYVFTWFKNGGRYSPAEVAHLYADMILRLVGAAE